MKYLSVIGFSIGVAIGMFLTYRLIKSHESQPPEALAPVCYKQERGTTGYGAGFQVAFRMKPFDCEFFTPKK